MEQMAVTLVPPDAVKTIEEKPLLRSRPAADAPAGRAVFTLEGSHG
jgi:hypothetical protein